MRTEKCYLCGQSKERHAVNCPETKKQTQRIVVNSAEPAFEDRSNSFDIGSDEVERPFVQHPNRKGLWTRPTVVKKKAFLSLCPDKPIASSIYDDLPQLSHSIWVQPDVTCRPYRLWIDDSIAQYFILLHAFVGATDQQNAAYDLKGIPATMFKTGRWPLPPNPDKDSEWGIDLSTWKSIMPSQMFTLVVRNIASSIMPFRGALEVWTVQ